MRRAPGTLLLLLLAVALQPATALGVDGDGEITFAVPLRATNGISAKLEADDDEIELTLKKGAQQATYFADGAVTREGIAVKFGRFGEFIVDYEPFRTLHTSVPGPRCEGEPATITEGFFRGTMRFQGEGDYVSIEAARAKGKLTLNPKRICPYGPAAASQAGDGKTEEAEATLTAGSRHPRIGFAAFGSRGGDQRPFSYFWAVSQTLREGVAISRLTAAGGARPGGFRFDNRRGTAFVDPPAPFAGSARFLRRPGGRVAWRGTLTAPLLGLGRVRLAGPGFHARMEPRLPGFE